MQLGLIWETVSPRTHKPKIVNESLTLNDTIKGGDIFSFVEQLILIDFLFQMLGSSSEIKGHSASLSPLMPSSVFSGESNCSIFIHILNTFILLISRSEFQPVISKIIASSFKHGQLIEDDDEYSNISW